MNKNKRLVDVLHDMFTSYWDKPALGDYSSGMKYSYKEVAQKMLWLHFLFAECKLTKEHKVAIIGKNCSNWAITYLATISNGSVVVPILEEFNPIDSTHILNHSESYILFCDPAIWANLSIDNLDTVKYVFSLENLSLLHGVEGVEMDLIDTNFLSRYPNGVTLDDVKFEGKESEDEMISLNYTSGTTSLTKGVMLSSRSLAVNITYLQTEMGGRGMVIERTICVLPMAHAYGLAFGFFGPLIYGAEVTFLGKTPSPNLMLEACTAIKPHILVLVPLIFEKIYKYNVAPLFNKPFVKLIHEIGFLDKILHRAIVGKIVKKLGGAVNEVILGGAGFNSHIERFFARGGFKFTIGYGMTECGPLISYASPETFALKSVGRVLEGGILELRIAKKKESDTSGEIQVRGDNVMLGYYKDPEATRATFTEDGWLKTGDKGELDDLGNIYIKGRYKTMLLGPSGENIYPEAIETKMTSLPLVGECYIVQNDKNKLDAYIYPDYARMKILGVDREQMLEIMRKNRLKLNRITASFENIASIFILEEPLPKTPKNTVKRYGLDSYLARSQKV